MVTPFERASETSSPTVCEREAVAWMGHDGWRESVCLPTLCLVYFTVRGIYVASLDGTALMLCCFKSRNHSLSHTVSDVPLSHHPYHLFNQPPPPSHRQSKTPNHDTTRRFQRSPNPTPPSIRQGLHPPSQEMHQARS